MARIYISISAPKAESEQNKISEELQKLSGSGNTDFKSKSFESADKEIFITYCEKEQHSFKYEFFEEENIHIVIGGSAEVNKNSVNFRELMQAYLKGKLNEMVKELSGSFYVCIMDQKKQQVVLVKDIFGATPIFYHQTQDCLSISNFSSLLSFAANDGKRKENKEFVARFSINHYAETYGEGHTFYDQVSEVKPASAITFKDGKKTEINYWDDDLKTPFFENESEAESWN